MSFTFYRKERPAVFRERFTAVVGEPTRLNSSLVFRAKGVSAAKQFTIMLDGRSLAIVATVRQNRLHIRTAAANATPHIDRELSEQDMALALRANHNSWQYLVARKLCVDHAASSAHSPFISGTIVNNFANSTAYPGFKLHLELQFRQPFANPFMSGNEREYFLVGHVRNMDCASIEYLGRSHENFNERISLIPRTGVHIRRTAIADARPSQIPGPV